MEHINVYLGAPEDKKRATQDWKKIKEQAKVLEEEFAKFLSNYTNSAEVSDMGYVSEFQVLLNHFAYSQRIKFTKDF